MISKELEQIGRVKLVHEFIEKIKKPTRIGLLYNKFCSEKGEYAFSYRTSQRLVTELAEREMINTKITEGGMNGKTTIVSPLEIKK